jgi:hypothetical protein
MTPELRELMRGLDPRERAILVAIFEHKVLLTEHLKAHPAGALDFYLEYDRGTETTRQLANKLAGYIGAARD